VIRVVTFFTTSTATWIFVVCTSAASCSCSSVGAQPTTHAGAHRRRGHLGTGALLAACCC